MTRDSPRSRRRLLATAAACVGALAGCASGSGTRSPAAPPSTTATDRPAATQTPAGSPPALRRALSDASVPFALDRADGGLDDVAATLADAPVVGIGETSHGVREFKSVPTELVCRLVADHGTRLVAIEETLGAAAALDAYVAGGRDDLDAALSTLDFYFWKTPAVRRLAEWLRAWNADHPDDQIHVWGYDAQFYDANARAVRAYLDRVDPGYLSTVASRLDPLTAPPGEGPYLTDDRRALLADLRERLRTRESRYVAASSRAAWELARRHVRTLERGLRFFRRLHAEEGTTRAEVLRDETMAENVAWLREWTGAERAAVLGNANHTMRGHRAPDRGNPRMGQHLTERFGDGYYSLGQAFGTGRFRAPTDSDRTAFATFDLGGPLNGTLAATLATLGSRPRFLDFAAARERDAAAAWLAERSRVGFTAPPVADRGAVPLPAAPGDAFDGVTFVPSVSPARFGV